MRVYCIGFKRRVRSARGVDMLGQMFESNIELVGRGHKTLAGDRLILRPMPKPVGAYHSRYTDCRFWPCPCHALCGFGSLLFYFIKMCGLLQTRPHLA